MPDTCYTPAEFATPADLERKKSMFRSWQGSVSTKNFQFTESSSF